MINTLWNELKPINYNAEHLLNIAFLKKSVYVSDAQLSKYIVTFYVPSFPVVWYTGEHTIKHTYMCGWPTSVFKVNIKCCLQVKQDIPWGKCWAALYFIH